MGCIDGAPPGARKALGAGHLDTLPNADCLVRRLSFQKRFEQANTTHKRKSASPSLAAAACIGSASTVQSIDISCNSRISKLGGCDENGVIRKSILAVD